MVNFNLGLSRDFNKIFWSKNSIEKLLLILVILAQNNSPKQSVKKKQSGIEIFKS